MQARSVVCEVGPRDSATRHPPQHSAAHILAKDTFNIPEYSTRNRQQVPAVSTQLSAYLDIYSAISTLCVACVQCFHTPAHALRG